MDGLGSILAHWHGHPDALIGLAILQGVYLLGIGPLRERYGLADSVDPRRVATFTLGVLVIFVAEVSPLHVLSDLYLFSAHMVQHVLLTLIAAPLLIMGTPDWLIRPLLRPDWVFRLARGVTHPIIALAAFNLIFSMWHVPAMYNLTVTYHWVHLSQHLLLMAVALLTWWPILSNMPELPRLSYPMQMGYLFLQSLAQIIVFGMLTFAREPIYEFYVNAPRVGNISPLLDQQLGGIIMKVFSGALFLGLAIAIFFRWFNKEEEQTRIEAAEREYRS